MWCKNERNDINNSFKEFVYQKNSSNENCVDLDNEKVRLKKNFEAYAICCWIGSYTKKVNQLVLLEPNNARVEILGFYKLNQLKWLDFYEE